MADKDINTEIADNISFDFDGEDTLFSSEEVDESISQSIKDIATPLKTPPEAITAPRFTPDIGQTPLINKKVDVHVTFPELLGRLLCLKDCDLDAITIEITNLNLLGDLLSPQEKDYLSFIVNFMQRTKSLPSPEFLCENFPELTITASPCNHADYLFLVSNFKSSRTLFLSSKELIKLSGELPKEGASLAVINKLGNIFSQLSNLNVTENDTFSLDRFSEFYGKKKLKPSGLSTCIKQLDDVIGGISMGSVSTIFGFVGSFKTMFALNIAYHNVFELGYNVVYLSLEVTKEDLWYNIFSRHSNHEKFKEFGGKIGHKRIRKCRITEMQERMISEKIIPDLKQSKGQLILLDETDFNSLTEMELEAKFHQIDKDLISRGKGGIDAIIIDYVQLFKHIGSDDKSKKRYIEPKDVVNSYMSFFRKLCLNFRGRPIALIPLSQCNREGFKAATKKGGEYDLTAIAEANEIERCSYRIMSLYSNEQLKVSKLVKLQLLKQRDGETIITPIQVYVDPEHYLFGDTNEPTESATPSVNDFSSLFTSTGGEDGGLADMLKAAGA